jgi:hypothetical protein
MWRRNYSFWGCWKFLGPCRTLKTDTKISPSQHCSFVHSFIERLYSVKEDVIQYPSTQDELNIIMNWYDENYLSGCGGSVDVVHVKWSKCPAGDYNRCKGKEGYPSVAFEVITGYDRQVLGISSIHLGLKMINRLFGPMRQSF